VTHFVRSNVFLSVDQKSALSKIARRRKISAASVLREILDKGLSLVSSTTDHSHIFARK
jgi:hypothetical protein